jgi:DNA-binding GntR family transcriptional regulator
MSPVVHVAAPVREQAANLIRAQIVSGALSPGQRLIEREMCEQLNISRNTLREACRQLESEGFLAIPPHKGPMVTKLTDREALSVYEVREALEGLAIRLFVERATDEQVDRLVTALAALADAYESADVATMLTVKNDFYSVLYEGADNPALSSQVRLLNGRLAQLRARSLSAPGRIQQSIEEVRAVVDRIVVRDSVNATRLWCEHIRHAAASALQPADGAGSLEG